jgi:pimeloyl-ACP methyl ester carboxylesterase
MRYTFFIIVLSLAAVASSAQGTIKLTPCQVPGTEPGKKLDVLCGKLEVFEDRRKGSGRKIGIAVQVYPSTGATKEPEPLFYIAGGPSSSAINDGPYIAADFAKVRETRDLVFVDQRGTGASNPLVCDLFDPKDVQSYLGHWNPPQAVRECRKLLEPNSDLRLYDTVLAMDDLDDVRAALGYEKINLFGASYGTRAVQTYMKRYGNRVRAALLHGVSTPDQLMPRDYPLQTEAALQGLLDECLADAACKAAFPNTREDSRTVLAALKKGPVEVDIKADGKPAKVKLSRDLAGEAVRYMLYQSGVASRIPLILNLAAAGNYTLLAETALRYRQRLVATDATGQYLSVTCAEDVPFIKETLQQRIKMDETFLGDYRLREMREACAEWPQGQIPKDYAEPLRSNVPVLITTGALDPVTPPLYGDRIAKNLPNSLHVVVPSGGHGFGGLTGAECLTNLKSEFFRTATPKTLDTSCVNAIKRRGFVLKVPG